MAGWVPACLPASANGGYARRRGEPTVESVGRGRDGRAKASLFPLAARWPSGTLSNGTFQYPSREDCRMEG
eukprot:4708251-Pyramimonas_sp.AAC.1